MPTMHMLEKPITTILWCLGLKMWYHHQIGICARCGICRNLTYNGYGHTEYHFICPTCAQWTNLGRKQKEPLTTIDATTWDQLFDKTESRK